MLEVEGKSFWIYGYNDDFGRIDEIKNNCEKAGNVFEGVIDNNALEGKCRIVSYDQFQNKYATNKERIIIFINLRDGNKHIDIANELTNDGYMNVIYLPIGNEFSVPVSREMRKKYNEYLYGQVQNLPEMNGQDLICEYGDYISFWMDVELLFSDVTSNKDIEEEYKVDKYYNCRITELNYYFELYDYFYSGGEYPVTYLKNSLMGRDPETFLENRRKLFDTHKDLISNDPLSMEYSPILIMWDEKDKDFKIKDGYHRIVSMIRNDYAKVPVICKKWEYDRYISSQNDI